jgi:copper resistance protein B
MMNTQIKWPVAVATLLILSPAWAQDHGGMNHETMPEMPDAMPGMSGQPGMNHQQTDDDTPAMDQEMIDMNHGSMPMQKKMPPMLTRDPHAYSGGYTRESGPYVLPGPQQLHLADEHNFGALLVNRLERIYTNNYNATDYDVQGWFGRNYDRLVIKAEGEIAKGKLQDARTELLWGPAIASFWDAQLGVRHDDGVGPGRGWLAFGVQGLAPYWFEMEATAYAGNNGKTALRLGAEYEMLLTQKLILQPRAEINLYGKSDPARDIGSGLSDALAGLRLRYEFTRRFAPYAGLEWAGKLGKTADFARSAGENASETRWFAGIRFWF